VFPALFEALFAYRPVVFQQGEFRFDVTAGALFAALVALGVFVAAVVTLRTVRSTGPLRHRVVLVGLRLAVLALLLFCLFRPALVIRAAVPQQNVVAVLLDDSLSMQIPDWDGQARAAFVREQFGASEHPLIDALEERFLVRVFRFSSAPGRVTSADGLEFNGSRTHLAAALDGAREELTGLPVAGMVLVSDGADTGDESLEETLLALRAEQIPVFSVGVGSEQLDRDIQIDRVTTPRRVLQNATLLIDVVITETGYEGRTVTLDVDDGGRIVGTQDVVLPRDGSPASVRVRAEAGEVGPRVFTFRVSPQEDEVVTQNNVRQALVEVVDDREKVLYFEGEPRFEMKFIRRGVAEDENLEIVALQRTADTRYMRIGGDEDEVTGGFPRTREELFTYPGLIIGSVEAGTFTGEQLQMISDFVDRRGGGLLMLGGARSFAEGGYGGTPVADALPFVIGPDVRAAEPSMFKRVRVAPTRAGETHAITQIAADEAVSLARWPDLPAVSVVNAPLALKPGATLLLNGTDEAGAPYPVLATQPFGGGRAIGFMAQDSWQWQMHASVSLEDQTHENFWRQLLRYLVDDVPGQVEAVTLEEQIEPGEAVTIDAAVVDRAFVELNDAGVMGRVTRPDGSVLEVPMPWTGEQDGQYRGTFVSGDPGTYQIDVEATRQGESLGSSVAFVRAGAGDAEYFDPTMHAAPMRLIADETGGRFYTPATVAGLPEDIQFTGRGVTSVEERELWNMPVILLLLVTLACTEWGYRRAVGLS
jgi:uncharacterized membrane protein